MTIKFFLKPTKTKWGIFIFLYIISVFLVFLARQAVDATDLVKVVAIFLRIAIFPYVIAISVSSAEFVVWIGFAGIFIYWYLIACTAMFIFKVMDDSVMGYAKPTTQSVVRQKAKK